MAKSNRSNQGNKKESDETVRDEFIEWIQLYVHEFSDVPQKETTKVWPGPSWFQCSDEFESWEQAVRIAGFRATNTLAYTEAEVARHIRWFANHYDESEWTAKQFNEEPLTCHYATVKKYFGSWGTAFEAVGFEHPDSTASRTTYTRKELIDMIQKGFNEKGYTVITDFDDDPDMASERTFRRWFGSWKKALVEAGVREDSDNDG